MKPDWKDAPEWAQWLAMDEDGSWGWYSHKPVPEGQDQYGKFWGKASNADQYKRATGGRRDEFHSNWQKSLEPRP